MKKGKHVQRSKNGILSLVLFIIMSLFFVFAIFALVMSVKTNSVQQDEEFKVKGSKNSFFEEYDSNEVEVFSSLDFVLQQNTNSQSIFNDKNIKTLTFTSYTDDIFKYKTQQNYLALTFDDCPAGEMDMILDVLDEYDMRCTFFMLGEYIEYSEGWAKEAVKRGHTVANHSYNHPSFKRISVKNMKNQLDKTAKLIEDETGIKPVIFRPPYGSYNNEVRNVLHEKGYTIAMWNVDSLDWKDKEHAYQRAAKAEKGDVVLFHTLHAYEDGLRWLLEDYKSRGLKSIPMEELIILEKLENNDTTSLKELGLELK